MRKVAFTYWRESDGKYLGCLNEYADPWAQRNNFNDLQGHLRDLFKLFASEEIPGIKRVPELEVA
jgi:hypothetical protein